MRTALFRWQMERVDIIAWANTSFNDYGKTVNQIREMDPDSPLPEQQHKSRVVAAHGSRRSA